MLTGEMKVSIEYTYQQSWDADENWISDELREETG